MNENSISIITHLHGDHIGGLVKDGQPVFPQAKLYIPSVELEAWTQDAKVQTLVAAYGASVVKFAIGDALPCGVEALAAYGHTLATPSTAPATS